MSNKIREYLCRPSFEKLGFEIISLKSFFKQRNQFERKQMHRLKYYAILFITNGKGKHLIDFKKFNYQKGSILFIGKDQVHSWVDSNDLEGYIIFFNETFLYDNQVKFNDLSYSYPYNSSLYKPILNLNFKSNFKVFKSLVAHLYKEFNLPKSLNKQEILQCLLRTLLLKIQDVPAKEFRDVEKELIEIFIKFQSLLEKKMSDTRNAADYCKYLNVSYRQLNEACKRLTNNTVKTFIDNILILKAKRQLINTDLNITEISYSLGFEEVTNFAKYFKKHENMSPKAFRQIVH